MLSIQEMYMKKCLPISPQPETKACSPTKELSSRPYGNLTKPTYSLSLNGFGSLIIPTSYPVPGSQDGCGYKALGSTLWY